MADAKTCAGPEELSVLMDLLSHDMLNKNQATLSYLELILSQPADGRRTRDFATMAAAQIKASSMLLDCIKRFVTSARSGKIPTAPADIDKMMESLAEDISDMFPFKKVTLDHSKLPKGAAVQGAQCVHDLFRNLLANIVQLSQQDDVSITVEGRQDKGRGTRHWTFTLTASSATIPQGIDDSVFSRLAKADVSKIARVSGAVFAASIARALGGSLKASAADPAKGTGCVFEVRLKEAAPA